MPKRCDYSECGESLLADSYEPASPFHDRHYCTAYCAMLDIVGTTLGEVRVAERTRESVDAALGHAACALNEVLAFLHELKIEPWPIETEDRP